MARINLIIEKAEDGNLWGRVNFRNNLMVDFASTVERLENKMRRLIKKFHGVEAVFDHAYDVSAFFESFDFLNQTKIADLSGINPSLLRQYASGVKHPSPHQAKKIEAVIHQLAKELKSVSLYA
jgi:hypothetical protein